MTEPRFVEEVATATGWGAGFGGILLAGRWLILWATGRIDRRQEVLDAQEARADLEWKLIREELRGDLSDTRRRLAILEVQNRTLRRAFQHVAGALILVDPKNPALVEAEAIMAAAFPLDLELVAERAEAALERAAEARP